MVALILKAGREKSLLRRHPWIFSGAIQDMEGEPAPGSTVDVLSSHQQFLARASYSPSSQIRGRVWTFDPGEQVDADFFRRKIRTAIDTRRRLNMERLVLSPSKRQSDAFRLVYAESDGIP